jgi:CTP-dependent riboflavin kinase
MLWDMPESINGKEANNNLAREIHEFRKFASKAEKDLNEKNTRDIVNRLRRIKGLANNMDLKIQAAIDRAIDLFQNADLDDFKIANAGELVTAFGRGQQYISIVKSIFSKRR